MDAEYEILAILWEGPRSRNEIVRAIGERRGLEPSPLSVYPSLQMLEDGDFVRLAGAADRRTYTLTGKGSALLAELAELAEGQDAGYTFAR
jgi:DNA-binding PadR family transcriptional regulator